MLATVLCVSHWIISTSDEAWHFILLASVEIISLLLERNKMGFNGMKRDVRGTYTLYKHLQTKIENKDLYADFELLVFTARYNSFFCFFCTAPLFMLYVSNRFSTTNSIIDDGDDDCCAQTRPVASQNPNPNPNPNPSLIRTLTLVEPYLKPGRL